MRAIAERAGVALGNAYYYFGSKEHLIQAFYDRTHVEHLAAVGTSSRSSRTSRRDSFWSCARSSNDRAYHRFAGCCFAQR